MNQTVFVTGASSGLGRAIALEYARRHARVIAGVRTPADGEKLAATTPGIAWVLIDLADPASIRRAAQEVDAACGARGLSILVNAAGYAVCAPILHTSDDDVQRLFQVLTFGPAQLANALKPSLARAAQASGARSKILNITSWASIDADPFVGHYAAAKAALLRFTQAQSYEFDRFGIDSSAIVPGLMKTPFVERAREQIARTLQSLSSEALRDYAVPLERLASLSRSAPGSPLAATPESVARRIVSISGRPRLRLRYDLGIDTAIVVWTNRILPSCLLRRAKMAMFHLGAQPRAA